MWVTGQLCWIIALWWWAAVNLLLSLMNNIMLCLQGMHLVFNVIHFSLLCYGGKILISLLHFKQYFGVILLRPQHINPSGFRCQRSLNAKELFFTNWLHVVKSMLLSTFVISCSCRVFNQRLIKVLEKWSFSTRTKATIYSCAICTWTCLYHIPILSYNYNTGCFKKKCCRLAIVALAMLANPCQQ